MDAPAYSTVPSLERRFELSSKRPHPGIFVSDFYVLRSLDQPGQRIQRHVQLHRGLNILWADPNPPEKVGTKKRSKVAGHTAGKSTFCRLLRYALGDVNYGTDAQQGKIINKFKDGWVVLRVEIEGSPWIVGRAFIDGRQCFALPHGDLDAFLMSGATSPIGYDDFATALDLHFIKPFIHGKFPGSRGEIHWRHLIPWFSRDQEARLLSLTTWRGPVGKSHAINTDTDERHFLMRLVLDLLPKEEANHFDSHAALNELKRVLDKNLPLSRARTEQAFAHLSEWIDVKVQGLEDPLYFDAAKAAHEAKQKDVNALRTSIPTTGEVEITQRAWEAAKDVTSEAAGDLKTARRRVTHLEKQIRECDARIIEQTAAIEDLRREPPASVCGVPIRDACETGKRAHASRPDSKALEVLLATIADAKSLLESELAEASAEVPVQRLAKEKAEEANQNAQLAYFTLSTRRAEKLEAYLEANAEQKARDRLLKSTGKVLTEKLGDEDALEQVVKDINKSTDDEAKARKEKAPDLGHFSDLYQRILRYMLGGEEGEAGELIFGSVKHDGSWLEVTAEGRNDLDSGAITAAKLISFDLAAMAWGMEGKGHHPRFLIHDSPREADMAEDIYNGLFDAALALEKACLSGAEPSFQYIVTTTAEPPAAINGPPWRLDPVLNAMVPSKRILAVDL